MTAHAQAPEWHRSDNGHSILIYTLKDGRGYHKGEPVQVNDLTIRIENANGSQNDLGALADRILAALSQQPVAGEAVAGTPGLRWIGTSSSPFFAVAVTPDEQRIPVYSMAEKMRVERAFNCGALYATPPVATVQEAARRPRFTVGDKVTVSSACEFFCDWEGMELTVVAVRLGPDGISHTYDTADGVSRRGKWENITDEWDEYDLTPALRALGEGR